MTPHYIEKMIMKLVSIVLYTVAWQCTSFFGACRMEVWRMEVMEPILQVMRQFNLIRFYLKTIFLEKCFEKYKTYANITSSRNRGNHLKPISIKNNNNTGLYVIFKVFAKIRTNIFSLNYSLCFLWIHSDYEIKSYITFYSCLYLHSIYTYYRCWEW